MNYKELKDKELLLCGKKPEKKILDYENFKDGNSRQYAILFYELTDEEFYSLPNIVNIDGYDFYKASFSNIILESDIAKSRKFIEI